MNELLLDQILAHPLLNMVREAIHSLRLHSSGQGGLPRELEDTGELQTELEEAQRAEEVLDAQPIVENC